MAHKSLNYLIFSVIIEPSVKKQLLFEFDKKDLLLFALQLHNTREYWNKDKTSKK